MPNLVSIDGKNVPPLFLREMLPWMIQSPLMPNIAIMMASATQSSEQQLMVKKSSETLSIQNHVFKIINQFLKQDFNQVGGEALRAVIHLAILEVSGIPFTKMTKYYGTDCLPVLLGIHRDVVAACERTQSNDQASRGVHADEGSCFGTSIHSVSTLAASWFDPTHRSQYGL